MRPLMFNQLTPAESERLFLLLEELGEVQQVIGKILRHGYKSKHPDGGPTNRSLLEKELGDVTHAMELLFDHCEINAEKVYRFSELKALRVKKYLHHQEEE